MLANILKWPVKIVKVKENVEGKPFLFYAKKKTPKQLHIRTSSGSSPVRGKSIIIIIIIIVVVVVT